jgi:hypothetical protein
VKIRFNIVLSAILILAVLVASFVGYIWYSGRLQTVANLSICNGLMHVKSQKFSNFDYSGQSIVLTYTKDNQSIKIPGLDPTTLLNEQHFLDEQHISYWPVENKPSLKIFVIDMTTNGYNPINLFIDPAQFSEDDFNRIGTCLKSEAPKIDAQLFQLHPILNQYELAGLTYASFEYYSKH